MANKKTRRAKSPDRVQLKVILGNGRKITREVRDVVMRALAAEEEKRLVARKIYDRYNEAVKQLNALGGEGTLFQARNIPTSKGMKWGQPFKLVKPRGGFMIYREVDLEKPTIKETEAAGLVVI